MTVALVVAPADLPQAGDAGSRVYTARRSRQAFAVIKCEPRYFMNNWAVQTVIQTRQSRACMGNTSMLLLATGTGGILRSRADAETIQRI